MLAWCVRRQVNTSYDVALWDVVRQHGHRAFVFLISRIFDFRKRCNFRECRSRSPRPIVKTEKSNFSELFSHQWGREWREGWRGQGWRGEGGEVSFNQYQVLRYSDTRHFQGCCLRRMSYECGGYNEHMNSNNFDVFSLCGSSDIIILFYVIQTIWTHLAAI